MQGMGIGKQLMEHLIGVAKENKIHKIRASLEKTLLPYMRVKESMESMNYILNSHRG